MISGTAVLGTSLILIPSFREKFNRNIFRPIKNYKAQLDVWNRIQT